MTQDKPKPQDQDAASVASDPSLNKEAVDEVVEEYERSANSSEDEEKLNQPIQKELGDVERALEDSVLGIEDAS